MRAACLLLLICVAGCATSGPSESDLRFEAQMSAMEDQQLAYINKDKANALRERSKEAKYYTANCGPSPELPVDSCIRLYGYLMQWDQSIARYDQRRREIEVERIKRQQLASEKQVLADIQRRNDIANAIQSAAARTRPITCRSEQWGKDIRTTCD